MLFVHNKELLVVEYWFTLFISMLALLIFCLEFLFTIHFQVGGTFDHLAFRRHIVRTLLQRSNKPATLLSGSASRPVDDVRFDGVGHHLVQNAKQARCRLCHKNARLACSKFMASLHLHCSSSITPKPSVITDITVVLQTHSSD